MDIFGLFAKHPQPGRVKTRLAIDVGNEPAAQLSAAFIEDLLDRFENVADHRIIAISPDDPESRGYFSECSRGRFDLWPQPAGDLGERMTAFFDDAFAEGAARVVLIGSDSPTLPRELVQRAFDHLEETDGVIGPATDGGYYLIGLRRPIPEVFREIGWSGPDVLSQTVARLRDAQIRPQLLPVWYDVDSRDDLLFLRGHLAAMRVAGQTDLPVRTVNWLERHTSQIDSLL